MDDRAEEAAVEAASFILALRARGIRDTGVLGAMELVPRELFAPRRFADLPAPTSSLPLALRTDHDRARHRRDHARGARASKPGQRVLEVGTGYAAT